MMGPTIENLNNLCPRLDLSDVINRLTENDTTTIYDTQLAALLIDFFKVIY